MSAPKGIGRPPRQLSALVLLGLALTVVVRTMLPPPPSIPPPVELHALLAEPSGQLLWIDARSDSAYAKQHIPGAILVNEDDWTASLARFLPQWNPRLRVVVYCESSRCAASEAVARRLRTEIPGIDVRVLAGGWEAWNKEHP